MTEEAMVELEEIRTTAQYHEQQLLDVAADVPGLRELLQPEFFKGVEQEQSVDPVEQYIALGEYLQQLGEKIERLRVAHEPSILGNVPVARRTGAYARSILLLSMWRRMMMLRRCDIRKWS